MDGARTGEGAARLAWLDALRGLAALAVAFHHATYHYAPGLRRQITAWFDPGMYGVMVFFLVSGYIIPASLERSRSLGRFWVGRVFRIYPLLLFALTAVVVIAATDMWPLRDGLAELDRWAVALAHLTMLQDLLAVPNALNVLWTLSYEMLFYLLVAALFAVGLHRRSAGIAAGLAGGAAAAVALGGLVPATALTKVAGVTPVVTVTALVMAAAIGCAFCRRPQVRAAGAVLGGLLAVVLLAANGRVPLWEGLVILAVMFTGTALYRAERGQIRVRAAVLSAGAVLVVAVAAGLWHMGGWGLPADEVLGLRRAWASALVLAALTFAAGMALRHRAMPRGLTILGVISYSVYLLHPVLLIVSDSLFGRPRQDAPFWLALFLAALVAAALLTQRLVERPAQRLGRRVARRLTSGPTTGANNGTTPHADTDRTALTH
ncbi:Peptidoglycan/LPS O-acetylase OafA/YrhL, contains acyltransferase and SGNH-hydrolase domains [Thermomonospora echinospora]|uniref:Peptidoglycan/LPS O-acetylase OafA/YrhL, contains acyltransferase and SGNH-hydrolase domains n=1 Tax=Thermomonospora echinospora TaxID=1992 RepID=A0A1H6BW63_9ACTN|nr:acyltransferase [Thermomonospora echinospora]SEG64882.1 Peptidoglycan/LPS O-acetylase OafA/YrhL, contains acyltransferase and SGNH-hydrolase domains [Thermomonospora echinospora]